MNLSKAVYAKKIVAQVSGCRLAFSSPTFNEFVLRVKGEPQKVLDKLKEKGILGGLFLARFYPELDHHILVTVTEMNRKEEIDRWAEGLERALSS
jgi:glycine dehydrogenase subunit 1